MKQRILSFLLVAALVLGSVCSSFAVGSLTNSASGLDNFKVVNEYKEGQFTDIKSTDWFSSFVASAYRLNLMAGNSATTFNPNGNVTIAETITVAAKLHAIYHTGAADCFEAASPWYMSFVNYAMNNGIISSTFPDYNRPATRSEYATILSKAFPESAFPVISDIEDNAIPDVPLTRSYAPAVYMLYRAGILSGSDSKGSFKPDSNIKRSEVATILIKLADRTQRSEMTLKVVSAMDAVSISQKCSSAVFYIEIYDAAGRAVSSGSGFFIDPSGIAVTNYHVIEGAASAKIKLNNGTMKNVAGVYDYSKEKDLALLKIEGSGYDFLEMDTTAAVAGQTVFAIGSPLGLDNTISQGIVSNPSRAYDGMNYIQFTAPISHGNSGGAVLNDSGKVIGVSSAFFDNDGTAQNLNLAIPVSYINSLSRTAYSPLTSSKPVANVTGSLHLETTSYHMNVGDDGYIPVYFTSNDYITVVFDNSATSVVSCEWGDFEDDWIPLNVDALSAGTARITIELYDDSETKLLDTATVTIKVDYSSQSKISYLKSQIMAKGKYSSSSRSYTLSTNFYDGMINVTYTPSDDDVIISFSSMQDDGSFYYTGFAFEDVANQYTFLCGITFSTYYMGSNEVNGNGVVYPATFTNDTALRFSSYTGPSSLRSDLEELAQSMLALSLYGVEDLFDQYGINCTLKDLNFKKF